jgi:hypothetical protein
MYRSQVDRLKREIADLEHKAAEERSRATRERGEARRIAGSISGSTNASTARSRLADAQRREESANASDKKAADYDRQIAGKNRQLSTAQSAVERALEQQRKNEDSEARRRRDEDLRHIRDLETRRRALQTPFVPVPQPALTSGVPSRTAAEFDYDVCMSFAGEERTYVEMVAAGLKAKGLRVFYDEDEKAKMWGKNLVEHFDHIYREASRYCVMFISAAYAAKPWTRHERRSALARALIEEGDYLLPARFDDTELPGLPPTVAWLDLRDIAPATLVEFVLEKLGRTEADSVEKS